MLKRILRKSRTQRLSDYSLDDTLGNHLDLLFSVKHQKQRALNRIMRQRLIDGRQMKGLGGRTSRPYREGLLVRYGLGDGCAQTIELKEPFGLDQAGDRLAVATGDEVRVYDTSAEVVHVYRNPWFAQLHSVYFSADGQRLLTASTGFDSVLEFDLGLRELTWTWTAWDHGYDKSPAGIRICRSGPCADTRKRINVNDAQHWGGFGLPTYLTTTHLNNACYRHDDLIFVTLFHQGCAIVVERGSGASREALSGLLNPHGFEPGWAGDHIVTDTRRGRVIFFDEHLTMKMALRVEACAPAESRAGLGEWLQNVLHLDRGLYAAIDIHRSCIWLFDPCTRRRRKIEVSPDWAVQNVIAVDPQRVRALHRLNEFAEIRHDIVDTAGLMTPTAVRKSQRRMPWYRKLVRAAVAWL
ncbi:hypothetical protein DX914_05080 [Lysobacter silvisoli]|uniref:WD40 repeat domain-containing protein n=1 Tax=Lysobacter silvisoli TaxID=2293254 RepID=A0A371K3K1_9GAMM|nr:hypothetical protein DX914_05080 [Lysobacter silvisoli]